MGLLIVIDGLDGSGKATQTKLAKDELQSLGYNVVSVSFPKYESDSSFAVKMYLQGQLGHDPNKLNPYMCSSFYAIDRAIQFEQELWKVYRQPNTILLADRYLSANIIHQGGKIQDIDKMHKFFEWVYNFETKKIGIPVEDVTIALDVPIDISQKLMSERYKGHEEMKDIHEENIGYLNKCHRAFNEACRYLPTQGYNWVRIDCSNNGSIRSIEDIHHEIMDIINRTLAKSHIEKS